jgi:hypothetical protein
MGSVLALEPDDLRQHLRANVLKTNQADARDGLPRL